VIKSAEYPYNTINGQDFLVWNFGLRFHFNGKETDNETQTQDYGFRIYNYRLSRFLSVDPLTRNYAFYTPYQFAGNKPIVAVDLDGREDLWYQYIKQNDGTLLLAGTHFDVNESTRNMLKHTTGQEIPNTGILQTVENGNSTQVVAYTPTVVITPKEDFGDMLENFHSDLYGSDDAQEAFIGGVDGFGKGVKAFGVAAAFVNPPAALGIYAIGEGITKGADLMKTSVHLEKGENKEAAIEFGGLILGGGAGVVSDKIKNETKKVVTQAVVDIAVDKTKDASKDAVKD